MHDNQPTEAHWQCEANGIMFDLKDRLTEFTADDFYRAARAVQMPPELIKRFAGSFFRRFQAAGYIVKTDRFLLSERNGSTPLPIWTKHLDKEPS